jgi:hypothetical protein
MTLDRKIKWLFGLIVLANLVIVLMVALGAFKKETPPQPMPNPNGYDDFAKAGKMLTGSASDYSTMKQEELAALVATNVEALKQLRIGLSLPCRVPNDYSTNYFDRLSPQLPLQKQLALNLCAEGRLAEMRGRTNDAAQSYLDAVSFALHCSQGGLLISKLVGIACESLGRSGLQPLTGSLSSQECRKIAQTLEILDTEEPSAADTWEQENEFGKAIGGFRHSIAALILYKQLQETKSKFIKKFQNNQMGRRQVMLHFAARAYELEKGKPPTASADLVPDYLKAIPKDPVTGSNLVLRASTP